MPSLLPSAASTEAEAQSSPESRAPALRGTMPGLIYLLTLIFFLNSLSRVVLAPLLPPIEAELGVGHGEAGSLFLFISLGYSVMLLASGFVAARVTHRWTIVLSLATIGLALISLFFAQTIGLVKGCLLLLGFGAGLYMPSGLAKITNLMEARHWGKAIAVHELAPNLASLAAPLLSSFLFIPLGWRGIVTLLGLICVAVGGLFAVFDRDSRLRGQPPQLALYRDILSNRAVWVMIALFSLGIGSNLGVYSMLSLYLVADRGYPKALADSLLTLSRLSTPLCVIAAGWAADRFGRKRVIAAALAVTGLTTCLIGLANNSWIAPLLFVQPVFAVSFFPAAFALLSSFGSPATRNLTVSVTLPFAAVIGTGIMPSLIGLAGDIASLGLGLSIWGALIVGGTWLLRKV